MYPPLRYSLVMTYLFPDGKRAKKGEVLAKFDINWLQQRIRSREHSLYDLQLQLERQNLDLELLKEKSQIEIQEYKNALMYAQAEYEKYVQFESKMEQKKKKYNLKVIQLSIERIKEKLKHLPSLLKEGFITQSRFRQEKRNLIHTEIKIEDAKHHLQVFKKYTKKITLFQLKNKIKQSKKYLENGKKKILSREKKLLADIKRYKTRISILARKLKKDKENVKKATIKAPFDSIVIHGSEKNPWMKDYISVGQSTWASMTLFTLPDISRVKMVTRIRESLLHNLKLQQPATIDVESKECYNLKGTVSKISEIPLNSWRYGNDKYFEVEITLEKMNIQLMQGTLADARIKLTMLPGVIEIPNHAIQTKGKKTFVYLWDGKLRKKEIEIISRFPYFTQVKNLKEGDILFLATPEKKGN